MEQERYWFEKVPEEQRYWLVAPWGTPPKREAEGGALDLPGALGTELEEIEQEVTAENVFGIERDKVRELRAVRKRMEAIGYAPGLVSGEWWPDVVDRWTHDEGNEHVEAPPLFTRREAAEKAAAEINEMAPEGYLDLVNNYGEAAAGAAFDNYVPRRALWVDRETLLEGLEEARFLCVMVDGRLTLREDFIEELRGSS